MNGSYGSNLSSTIDDPSDDESRVDRRAEFGRVTMRDAATSVKPTSGLAALKPGAHFCTPKDELKAKTEAYAAKTQDKSPPRIEIAPGVTARLRGSAETFECVERDFYLPVNCFCCSQELCCIMDAGYVICPTCRVVSPMDNGVGNEGGVGLGFSFDDLRQMQWEILQRRRQGGRR